MVKNRSIKHYIEFSALIAAESLKEDTTGDRYFSIDEIK